MAQTLLYQATDPTEAYLIRDYLTQRGLRVSLRGVHLTGLAGAIPVTEAQPSLWVEAVDLGLARLALAGWRAESLPSSPWTCPGCGEENEGSFGSCWSCQTLRP
ncbi:MAG: DUF2007 domain-containing protein [Myxococcota bacterium]|nr:DUF2007 domain-containing protein [Myxococcota bacterium]